MALASAAASVQCDIFSQLEIHVGMTCIAYCESENIPKTIVGAHDRQYMYSYSSDNSFYNPNYKLWLQLWLRLLTF